MKKSIISLFVIVLTLCLCINVFADSETVSGNVTFDGKTVQSSFSSKDFTEAASALLPGDSVVFSITLKNNHSAETDWWMKNIIDSFEQIRKGASGSAYTYILRYDGPNNTRTIYESDTVGGETTINLGLASATSSLKDYFKLGSLKAGESGKVTLTVALDGETEGNAYQNKLADLKLNFAVELTQTTNQDVVKTGDNTQIMPYVIAATISGVLLLVIAFLRVSQSRKPKKKRKA